MKRHLSILLAAVMSIFCLFSTSAFAAEVETPMVSAPSSASESEDNEAVTYGYLSGYGQHWYNAGESTTGSFYVDVTGSWALWAQITLSIEDFGPNDRAYLVVYKPDGSVAWQCSSYTTVANSSTDFQNLKFYNAPTGRYRVTYELNNYYGEPLSSGRINCWIY